MGIFLHIFFKLTLFDCGLLCVSFKFSYGNIWFYVKWCKTYNYIPSGRL